MKLYTRHACDACGEQFDTEAGKLPPAVILPATTPVTRLKSLMASLGVGDLGFCSKDCKTAALSRVPWDCMKELFLERLLRKPSPRPNQPSPADVDEGLPF